MKKLPLRSAAWLGGVGLLLLLIAFGAVAVSREVEQGRAEQWVAHTTSVLGSLMRARMSATDAKAAAYAWAASHQQRDSDDYAAALGRVRRELDDLVALVADNPGQAERVRAIVQVAGDVPVVPGGEGQQQIAWIQARLDEMRTTERALLLERQARSRQVSGWTTLLAVTGAVASVVGIALALLSAFAEVRTRRELAEAAEVASAAKSRFLASMSHELRTPLNAILGFAELMQTRLTDDERARYLNYQVNAARALLALINDILDFSKIEAGKLDLLPGPFRLKGLVEECRSMMHPAAAEKGLRFDSRIAAGVPEWVEGDGQRVRQILLNLLSNAVKFTLAGGVTLTVAPGRQAGSVRFAVQDTGPGLSEEQQSRLFKEFTQVGRIPGKAREGTGLGLAISRSLAELMGGRIGVDSHVGTGSTFWLELPLPETEPAAAALTETGEAIAAAPASILVVEDIEANQVLVRKVLETAGHHVIVADNGAVALDIALSRTFDLVLMDIEMPLMDGTEACRRIRALGGAWGELPILALTAHAVPTEIERCRAAGMNDHISKPFVPSQLLARVNRALSGRERVEIPEAPPMAAEVLHEATVTELTALLGAAQVEELFAQLRDRLGEVKRLLDRPEGDLETLRREAHALISHSGSLGFQELSKASRRLADACRNQESPDDISAAIVEVGRTADRALERLPQTV